MLNVCPKNTHVSVPRRVTQKTFNSLMEAVSFYLIAASGSSSLLLGTSSTGLRAVRGVFCFVGTIKMTSIILPSLLVALSILTSVQGVPDQAAEQPQC